MNYSLKTAVRVYQKFLGLVTQDPYGFLTSVPLFPKVILALFKERNPAIRLYKTKSKNWEI